MKLFMTLAALFFAAEVHGLETSGSTTDEIKKTIANTPPPEGFSWVYIEELNCGLLQPKEWVVTKAAEGGSFAVVISQETPVGNVPPAHFLKVVFTAGENLKGTSTVLAKQKRDEVAKRFKVVYKDEFKGFPMESYNCIFLNDQLSIGVFSLFTGNAMTNSLYSISFSAPKAEFDSYFQNFGIALVNNQIVDMNR